MLRKDRGVRAGRLAFRMDLRSPSARPDGIDGRNHGPF